MKRLIFSLPFLFALLLTLSACGHEHSFSEWETVTDATCESAGIKTRICECGESESSKIELKGHSITIIDPIEPTCDEFGYTQGTLCSDCGKFIEEPEKIEPMHNYVASVTVAPTCTASGTNLYACSNCDFEYMELIDPIGHNFKSATCITQKICTECEYTVGLPLGHTTDVGICERCNEFVQPRIILPESPITASVEITGYKTVMEITDISYRFSKSSVTFTFSAKKIVDEGELTDGKFVCGFSYRLYDIQNNLIHSDKIALENLAVGDSVSSKIFYLEIPEQLCDSYILIIENYN